MIEVEKVDQWNYKFFKRFVAFKNALYCKDKKYLKELLGDFKKLYYGKSPFIASWEAVVVWQNGCIVGRIMFFYNHALESCSFGYFEAIDCYEVAEALLNEVVISSRRYNVQIVKGPIEGNFYNRYRLKDCREQGDPFYGEPIGKSYYAAFFKRFGFEVTKRWVTTLNDLHLSSKSQRMITYLKRKLKSSDDFVIRCVDLSRWDQELKLFYYLFMNSFQEMSEFEWITWEQFKYLYNDLRYIIDQKSTLIAEVGGRPVAFSVGYFDPLPVFLFLQRMTLLPNFIKKIIGLFLLRRNHGVLLIPYLGKISGSLQGIQLFLIEKILTHARQVCAQKVLGCYIADDSKVENDGSTIYSRYSLYQLETAYDDAPLFVSKK